MPDHVSPEARDLIDRMLQKDPQNRITLSAVLDHSFMVKIVLGLFCVH